LYPAIFYGPMTDPISLILMTAEWVGDTDLWMLLSGDRAEMTLQLNYLLTGYQTFYDFNARELHLLEALRTYV